MLNIIKLYIKWSGEAVYLMYDMLVQWVKTGKGWVTSFEEDFQYHKVYCQYSCSILETDF